MTLEELKLAKEFYERIKENVERITSIYQDSNNSNAVLDDTDDSRIKIQYEAALTDPRRI